MAINYLMELVFKIGQIFSGNNEGTLQIIINFPVSIKKHSQTNQTILIPFNLVIEEYKSQNRGNKFMYNLNFSKEFNHIIIINNIMINKLPFEFPLLVCAPMVEQSELPFRMLTRKYGCNLCYTPMLHSKMMITQKKYKQEHFTTCPQDRPLVAQLCGNDPDTMVKAAKMVEDEVDAIDINFGCPQGIARKGHYGSYLLQEPQLVEKLVKGLVANVKVPIFCKIRIRKTQQKTFEVVNKIINAGCSLLTVHGRTKQQNKDKVGACDWKIIKKIKEHVNIPVVANGGIYKYQDVEQCLNQTGVDGVMSAESLLQNPALFSQKIHCLDRLALEYLQLVQYYPGASDSCIRAHLFKMCFKGLSQHVQLRQRMTKAKGVNQFRQIVKQLSQLRKEEEPQKKLGWYTRYWHKNYVNKSENKEEQNGKEGYQANVETEKKQQEKLDEVGEKGKS